MCLSSGLSRWQRYRSSGSQYHELAAAGSSAGTSPIWSLQDWIPGPSGLLFAIAGFLLSMAMKKSPSVANSRSPRVAN